MCNGGHCKSSKNGFGVSQSRQKKMTSLPGTTGGAFLAQLCGCLTPLKTSRIQAVDEEMFQVLGAKQRVLQEQAE